MIVFENDAAYITGEATAVQFVSNVSFAKSNTAPIIKKFTTAMDVAPWGEDNRFPQNIVNSLAGAGVAQSLLKWKTNALYGAGLVYGQVVDIDAQGNEVFRIAKKGEFVDVDKFWKTNNIPRYFAEFGLDYYYFANCWPELIMDNSREKIAGIVHQESCDCRWKQMTESGKMDTVFLSKLWGLTSDQFSKFDKDKKIRTGVGDSTETPTKPDGKFFIKKKAIDMYFPTDSLTELVKNNKDEKSFILPVTFPSPNKTYYQLAPWDGVRVAGWIDIAVSVPSMLKALYKNAFSIRYHIEIPENHFIKTYGKDVWASMDKEKRKKAKEELLQVIEKVLSGEENKYNSLVTLFDVSQTDLKESGRVKITKIDSKNETGADLLTSGTANSEIAAAMGVNPNILGLGKPGGVYASNQGGSNIREGKLEHDAGLSLDRQLALEPFKLIKEFNQWPDELEFRFKDTVLLTLDKGKQTETKLA